MEAHTPGSDNKSGNVAWVSIVIMYVRYGAQNFKLVTTTFVQRRIWPRQKIIIYSDFGLSEVPKITLKYTWIMLEGNRIAL